MEGSLWPMLGMFGDGKYRSQRPLALYASTESGQTYPLWSSSNLVADSPNTMLPVQAAWGGNKLKSPHSSMSVARVAGTIFPPSPFLSF